MLMANASVFSTVKAIRATFRYRGISHLPNCAGTQQQYDYINIYA